MTKIIFAGICAVTAMAVWGYSETNAMMCDTDHADTHAHMHMHSHMHKKMHGPEMRAQDHIKSMMTDSMQMHGHTHAQSHAHTM
jgi:hypothetical protein